ncbi:MAG: hypothetical protein BWY05_00584 [Euryarchaeota archaeon ADurb.Bin165]|nr:MAG: hypothetical protein BWY05_00584 [Euryarchaeota archaeon ADurb.Bin165]
MMSCPCGLICAGKSGGTLSFPSQPVTCITDMDESIHVSRTSVSGTNSELPHFGQECFGTSTVGSIGSSSSSGRITSPQSLHNQTGIGVAKILCLEMHQSHSICVIQFSIRRNMCSGYHLTSFAAFNAASCGILTNH